MNIAVYSAFISQTSIAYIKNVVDYLNRNNHKYILIDSLKKYLGEESKKYSYFNDDQKLDEKVDFLFSVGGDGTLLRSISLTYYYFSSLRFSVYSSKFIAYLIK